MNGIVTLDIGTSSIRASLHDESGEVVFREQRPTLPRYSADGRVELEASVWEGLLPRLLRRVSDEAMQGGIAVGAISITAQRSSVIAVDAQGRALRPAIMWQDLRTAALAATLAKEEELVFRKTGLRISPVFSAIKMLWLRREEPEVFGKTQRMLGIQDYVLFLLSGRFVTDESFASRTNLLDLATRRWDPDLIELFEVDPSMLCDIVAPGSIVGGLLPEIATATGLLAGTPIVSAGGDQQCAALGLGLFSKARVVANTGTGSYLIGHADAPVIDPRMRLSCNVAALPGAYIVEAALPTSGAIYRWFAELLMARNEGDQKSRRKTEIPADEGPDFASLNAEAKASGPGAGGVILLPHFKGSGSPHWDTEARGNFYNLSLSTSRGDLARSILEGIAFELGKGLDLVQEFCGPVESVAVSGGMSDSELFNHIQADVFRKPTIRLASGEATSRGAWMAGAVAIGLAPDYPGAFALSTRSAPCERFEPDGKNGDRYAIIRKRADALYTALASPDFRQLQTEDR